jgi:hypothetical protein
MTGKPFLPPDEQRFYDRTVDGLRQAGWTRDEAEAEAIARVDTARQRKATKA